MSTLSLALLSSIISDIYHCAATPSQWPTTLGRMSHALDTACTTIQLVDRLTLQTTIVAHSPCEGEQVHALNEAYGAQGSAYVERVLTGPLDIPYSTLSHAGQSHNRQTDADENWVQTQELEHSCSVKFAESKTQACILKTFMRAGQGALSTECQQFLALLSPHLRRASRMSGVFDQTQATIKNYQATLDMLGTPVLLLNREKHVVYQNTASEYFLRSQTALVVRNGTLFAKCPLLAQSIDTAVGDAAALRHENCSPLNTIKTVMPFHSRGTVYEPGKAMITTVVSLEASESTSAVVAVFISMSGIARAPQGAAIATLFDLTPAEARIMIFVGNGACVRVAADTIGLSVNTVKSHLASIYAKTGVSRQPELVKLLSDICTPAMHTPT